MKSINEIVEEHAAGIPDEAKAAIVKAVKANYRTIAEFEKKTERISQLESANAELAEAASKVEGTSAEIDALKAQLRAREEADAKRKAEEEAQAARERFRVQFDKAVGDRRFANERTRNSVFEESFAHAAANAGVGAAEAIEAVTAEDPDVWVAAGDPRWMPLASPAQGEPVKANSLFAAMFAGRD